MIYNPDRYAFASVKVGDIVDYYPNNNTRLAAIVIETHPSENNPRPNLDLNVFKSDTSVILKDVHPVDPENLLDDNNFDQPILQKMWGFSHEFPLLQEEEIEDQLSLPGTKTNYHIDAEPNI